MRTLCFLACSILLLTACGGARMAQTPLSDEVRVVMLGIGAKNPTFDDQRFPHLRVVYAADLRSQASLGDGGRAAVTALAGDAAREQFSGEPADLARWWDEMDLRNHALFIDRHGVVAWQGWIDRRDGILKSASAGDGALLGSVMAEIIEDGLPAPASSQPFDPKKADGAIGASLPDWSLQAADGSSVKLHTVLADAPTLLVIFQIQSTGDLQAAKRSQEDKSFGSFMSSMMQGAASDKVANMFVRLESELFDHRVR